MTSLRHARAAVLACRDFGLPVFVTMVVDDEGRTAENNSLLSCLVTLQELGISAFGLNCSAFPADMTEFFEELAPFAKILSLIHISTLPKLSTGLTTPVDFIYTPP